jgi:uncharacterized protein (DUF1501 family)
MSQHDSSGSRRRFLARSAQIALGSAAAWATLGRLQMVQAAPRDPDEDYKALVCIYLYGGNDSFNMVAPRTAAAYGHYQSARPNLAIPQASLLPISPLSGGGGTEWGLHPSMPELQSLFESGHAALLANVGPLVAPTSVADFESGRVPLPPQLFSHVDQQAYSMSMGSETAARAGWAARIADRLMDSGRVTGGILPTNISVSGSNMWQGGAADGVFAMDSSGPLRIDGTLRESMNWSRVVPRRDAFYKLLDAASRESSIFAREHARISSRAIEFSELAYSAISNTPPLSTPFPAPGSNRLADSLRTVARTIAAREQLGQKRQVFFIGVGGWDMHDNMLADHTELLGLISRSLALFHSATVELGVSRQVTTFTMTDFGRTLNNNGDGTDHGWGGHSWLVGGDVVGRRIYGQMPELRLGSNLDVGRGRIIPTTSIDQLGSTLARWFGLRYGDAVDIFPNLRNFGSGADYLPMLASSNRLINEIDFERRTMR